MSPDEVADLRFDGDTLVLTDVDGEEGRYVPSEDGRYLMSFGWAWHQVEPIDVSLIFGVPEAAESFAAHVDALRQAGIAAYAATLCDCLIVQAELDDGSVVNLRPQTLATQPRGDADAVAVRDWLMNVRSAEHARHAQVAAIALRSIETAVDWNQMPPVRSWYDVLDHTDGNHLIQDAAIMAGCWRYDYVTMSGAVGLIDAALSAGEFTVPPTVTAESVSGQSPGLVRQPEVIAGDWQWQPDEGGGQYEEAYVGTVVSEWNGWAEWLTSREVAERVVLWQRRSRAEAGYPDLEEMPVLSFDGDTLVETTADCEYRYPPTSDGRYRIAFGWTWTETDLAKAEVVYGDPRLTRTYGDVLAALRADGVPAVVTTAWGRSFLRAELPDRGHVDIYADHLASLPANRGELRRWSAIDYRPTGEADYEPYRSERNVDAADTAEMVRHVVAISRALADLVTEQVADAVLRLVRADVAAGTVPAVRSFADLHDHADANEYLIEAASEVGVSTADHSTLNAAVEIVDAGLRTSDALAPPSLPADVVAPKPEAQRMTDRLNGFGHERSQPPDLSL